MTRPASRGFLTLSLVSFICLLCWSCQQSGNQTEPVIVSGDLGDTHSFLEGKWLYLENLDSRTIEDSTLVQQGKFQFIKKLTKDFVPYKVNLTYRTGKPAWPFLLLGIKNPFFNNSYESSFYLEKGTVRLEEDHSFKPFGSDRIGLAFTHINPQTVAAYKHLSFRLTRNALTEMKQINRELVDEYAYSIDLLDNLYRNKKAFSQQALTDLLASFDPSLHTTQLYKNFLYYTKRPIRPEQGFPVDLSLQLPDGRSAVFPFDTTKYNLVVFWASWCGPCRGEIPQIKALYAAHKDRLTISSISIDQREDQWKRALQNEQMPWKQYLLPRDTSFAMLEKQYTLTAVPLWLLFDAQNRLIDQQVGMNTDENAVDKRVAARITQ
jgi:thiol-disulfide isomerase/thioredoxin